MIAAYNRGVTTDPAGIPPDLPPDVLGRIPLFAELQKVLSWTGGPVNWDLARQVAVAAAAAGEGVHRIDPSSAEAVAEDARIAELWVAEATGLPVESSLRAVRTVTPAEFAEHACVAYRELIDPLAAKVSAALAEQAGAGGAEFAVAGMDGAAVAQAMRQMAPLLLGVQTGGVIGGIAKDVLGGHDLPLPADGEAVVVVLPNVDRVSAEYGVDPQEFRLWAALHETAHRAAVDVLPAARPAFFARYHDYVASLEVDFSSAFERLQGIDLSDPSGLESHLGSQGLFDLLDSPASADAAGRLEGLVAILEAFADRAVEAAAEARLPSAARIAEAAARHRASSGAAASLQTFLGIGASDDARRAADRFTRAVEAAAGWGALARIWDDAGTLPSPAEIADPDQWLRRIG